MSKEAEDKFIERCRADGMRLTWESEILLRYGYAAGDREATAREHWAGLDDQQNATLDILGAQPRRYYVEK